MICSATLCNAAFMDDPELELGTAGGRLRWARRRAFPRAKDFARAAKVGEVTYRAYENDQNSYAKHAPLFGRLLNVPTDWLLEGGPTPDSDPPDQPPAGEFGTPEVLVEHDIELVRQVDISYAMGDGSIVEDYPDSGFVPFDRNQLRRLTRGPTSMLFLATGHGDSMTPTLLKDDLILVDAGQNQVMQQDRIWALSFAGAGMVKRLRRLPGGRYLILSDNQAVPPQEAGNEDIHIVGKVVWIGRDMT